MRHDFQLHSAERLVWSACLAGDTAFQRPRERTAHLLDSGLTGCFEACADITASADETLYHARSQAIAQALAHDAKSRANFYQSALLVGTGGLFLGESLREATLALDGLHRCSSMTHLPACYTRRAWLRVMSGDVAAAQEDLDDAWNIAERGEMRAALADIRLHRARLFHARTPYPWDSPKADLGAAEDLIEACGYGRRDRELAEAKRVILR
jgi:hypothetical protein